MNHRSRFPISFVIPAYNCSKYLSFAVASIANGNLNPHDEVLIVDDGSTDDTPSVIELIARKYPQVRTFQHLENKGSAAAGRNTAFENAEHGMLFCLDADNLLVPNSIHRLAKTMIENSADTAAFGAIRYFNEYARFPTHQWVYKEGEIYLADALAGHYWPGPSGNYMVSKRSWYLAGGYPENVGEGIDSWAFGIKQLVTGSRMFTCPGTFYLQRYGHESASTRDVREGGISCKALRTIEDHLDLLDSESVEYVMGVGKLDWYERLKKRPLKLAGKIAGCDGESQNMGLTAIRVAIRNLLGK